MDIPLHDGLRKRRRFLYATTSCQCCCVSHSPPSAMTSLVLMDFFGLAEAKRVMTTRPENTHIWHAHYTTIIQCASHQCAHLQPDERCIASFPVLDAWSDLLFIYFIDRNSAIVIVQNCMYDRPAGRRADAHLSAAYKLLSM
jgi:hypothetical protein